ncbi:TIGR04013 family B12-binding domain/radical SAM domain-containing protein [bacterium]|nr:TIGR04013 family B12-binding domain/radical SAM domain-containing protein [bacterium]
MISVIFYYKATNTYALNVLIGAIQEKINSQDLEIILANRVDNLIAAILDTRSQGHKVLTGWSFYSPHYTKCIADLKFVKQAITDPEVVHLAGGVHATAEPESTLRAGFDYVAIGESEKTITAIVQNLIDGKNIDTIKGIAFLHDGKYHSNGSGELIDLDEFPPMAPKFSRVNPIEITRGCVYACSFCQTPFMFKARFRHRSVENVCEYVAFMMSEGAKDVRFITPTSLSYGSDEASVNLEKIEHLLSSVHKTIAGQGRIFFGTFPSEVRPEHVTPEALRLIKKYCHNDNILMGAQSGSSSMLDKLHRGHDVESIRRAVRYCIEEGFLPNVDFIFGLPEETREDVRASLALADELTGMGARIHGHTFMPLPGTPLKNAPPGHVDQDTLSHLHKLVAKGKLYGQWNEQAKIAHSLASRQVSK